MTKKSEWTLVVLCLSLICLMGSCTYSINMVHTDGDASDVIDENQSADPNISPEIEIPLTDFDPAELSAAYLIST